MIFIKIKIIINYTYNYIHQCIMNISKYTKLNSIQVNNIYIKYYMNHINAKLNTTNNYLN